MKTQLRWILVLAVMLGLLVACGGSAQEAPTATPEPPTATPQPTNTPVPPTATPAPTATTAPAETADAPAADQDDDQETLDLDNLLQNLRPGSPESAYESYEFDMRLRFTEAGATGTGPTQAVTMTMAYNQDPPQAAISMIVQGVAGAEEFSGVEMAQVEDTVYMSVPSLGCITSDATEFNLLGGDNPLGENLSPDSFLQEFDLREARRVRPDEVINGIDVAHYTFDESMMDDPDIETAEGHVYIAKEGGYPVRLTVEAEGTLEGMGDQGEAVPGVMFLEYNLRSVNEPVEVAIPADCENQGAAVDLPTLEDAYELSSFSGFVSYKSDVTFDEAVAFYQEALADEGWVVNEDESFSFSGVASYTYDKDGESLSVTISEEDDGSISVLLMTEESDG